MNDKRIFKDKNNKMLSGVCSGIANFFNIDPTLVRLLWVLVAIFTAFFPALIAYIIFACIIPYGPIDNEFQGNGTYNNQQQNYQQQNYQQQNYQQPNYQQPNNQQPPDNTPKDDSRPTNQL